MLELATEAGCDPEELALVRNTSEGLQIVQQGIELLRSWGHAINSAPDPTRHWGYYAGSDAERLADFAGEAELWACARGGWGAARLLEQGWQPPQGWLLGFSDVTSLLWAQQAAGLSGAIHGPLVTTLANEMKRRDAKRGLVSICGAGATAVALLLERD